MKKWLESRLGKVAAIALACLSAAGLVLSVMWAAAEEAALSVPVEDLLLDGKGDGFWESSMFRSELMWRARQELEFYKNRWMLGSDGKLNREALVDIGAATGHDFINGLSYTLGDLLDWNKYLSQSRKKTIVACRQTDDGISYFYLPDFRKQFEGGQLKAVWKEDLKEELGQEPDIGRILKNWEKLDGQEISAAEVQEYSVDSEYSADSELEIEQEYSVDSSWADGQEYTLTIGDAAYNDGELAGEYLDGITDRDGNRLYTDFWIYQGSQLAEPCQPQGDDSLLELVNKNQWELSEIFDILSTEIATLTEMAETYETGQYERAQDTNVQYLYVDLENGQAFSNREAFGKFKAWEDSLEQLKLQDSYTWLSKGFQGSSYESSMKGSEKSWRHMVEDTMGQDGRYTNYVFAVAVDTALPARDWVSGQRENFQAGKGILKKAIGVCVACGVLLLAVLVWLTCAAGHSRKRGGVALNFFDRWKTEIAAALVLTVWYVLLAGMAESGIADPSPFAEYLNSITGSGSVTGVQMKFYGFLVSLYVSASALAFLWGYLSLVRRCKGRTLWKNSLLYLAFRYGIRYGGRGVKCVKKAYYALNVIPRKVIALGGFLAIQLFFGILMFGFGNSYYNGILTVISVFWFLTSLAAAGWVGKVAVEYYKIQKGIRKIADGDIAYQLPVQGLTLDRKAMAQDINRIGEGLDQAVEKSLRSERLKTELITNVSHDIKTPLTSIINYVDLLKREQLPGEHVQEYLSILEKKSQQLKNLTEDVVEASKASTGNLALQCDELDLVEMILQVNGEFQEKFQQRDLSLVLRVQEDSVVIWADGRRMWRILENIYQNAFKYAMPHTRVYVELSVNSLRAVFTMKNISEQPLDISPDELTERFVRGDSSRNTQGSGLGLSIARSLTELQAGEFQLFLDGDLFKVQLSFPLREGRVSPEH